MGNVFKNYTTDGAGTSLTTVYTVPSSTTAVIIGANLANVTDAQIEVDVLLGSIYLIKGVPIPANTAFSMLDGKIIAEAADTIKVQSDTASSVDVVLSVLEQS
jgi:hypothetical protein